MADAESINEAAGCIEGLKFDDGKTECDYFHETRFLYSKVTPLGKPVAFSYEPEEYAGQGPVEHISEISLPVLVQRYMNSLGES